MYITVFVTVPKKEAGVELAREILKERLAACVQVKEGLTSLYWWDNEIQEDPECLLIMKTKLGLFEELAALVKNKHPYDVPEVVAMPIVTGNKEYLDWLSRETKVSKDDPSIRSGQF